MKSINICNIYGFTVVLCPFYLKADSELCQTQCAAMATETWQSNSRQWCNFYHILLVVGSRMILTQYPVGWIILAKIQELYFCSGAIFQHLFSNFYWNICWLAFVLKSLFPYIFPDMIHLVHIFGIYTPFCCCCCFPIFFANRKQFWFSVCAQFLFHEHAMQNKEWMEYKLSWKSWYWIWFYACTLIRQDSCEMWSMFDVILHEILAHICIWYVMEFRSDMYVILASRIERIAEITFAVKMYHKIRPEL